MERLRRASLDAEEVDVDFEADHGLDERGIGLERGLVDLHAPLGQVLAELVTMAGGHLPARRDLVRLGRRARTRTGVAFRGEALGEADEHLALLEQPARIASD